MGQTMTSEGRQAESRAFLLPLAVGDAAGKVSCLFSQNQVVEILGRRPIQRIPFSPAYLDGVMNYFDQLLPVINLDELCSPKHLRYSEEKIQQLMVIRTGVVHPVTGEPLKAAIVASTRVQMAKLSAQVLATFVESEAPSSLKATGVLRGFFQGKSGGIALLDLSQVVLGTFGDVTRLDGKQEL
jgi:purine-binding chemotaxis protein CheW